MTAPADLIPVNQAATICGVHPRTVRRWIAVGRLRGYRVGPRLLKVEESQAHALTVSVATSKSA